MSLENKVHQSVHIHRKRGTSDKMEFTRCSSWKWSRCTVLLSPPPAYMILRWWWETSLTNRVWGFGVFWVDSGSSRYAKSRTLPRANAPSLSNMLGSCCRESKMQLSSPTLGSSTDFYIELEQLCCSLSVAKACIWNIGPNNKSSVLKVIFKTSQLTKSYGSQIIFVRRSPRTSSLPRTIFSYMYSLSFTG